MRLDTNQRLELVYLLQDGRFTNDGVDKVLNAVEDGQSLEVDRSVCPDVTKLLHHSTIRAFLDAERTAEIIAMNQSEEAKTSLSSSSTSKKKNKVWTDTELHGYWMEILRGAYKLTVRRYICALRIATLLFPDPVRVEDRVTLVKSLLWLPSPNGIFHQRTPLYHSTADHFRRDAMQRLNLKSIRTDREFEAKYNDTYFVEATKLYRKLEREIEWLRRSLKNPSYDIML